MLDLRFVELAGAFTAHVIVEGSHTFQGAPREPAFSEESLQAFRTCHGISIHNQVVDMSDLVGLPPDRDGAGPRERRQRDACSGKRSSMRAASRAKICCSSPMSTKSLTATGSVAIRHVGLGGLDCISARQCGCTRTASIGCIPKRGGGNHRLGARPLVATGDARPSRLPNVADRLRGLASHLDGRTWNGESVPGSGMPNATRR